MKNSEFRFPGLSKELIDLMQKAACKAKIHRLALVGGAVRDWLIHQEDPNRIANTPDLDFVVQGSATAFAEALVQELLPERIQTYRLHSSFDTVELQIDGLKIDLATARKEEYKSPGENPRVFETELEKDLERRDFTINAIAVELPKGNILDLHQGQRALLSKELFFLHSKSIAEDPTRIYRGARYAARLGFRLSSEAFEQLNSTLVTWPWSWKIGNPPEFAPPALSTRLRKELELLFKNEPWNLSIKYLQEWGALRLLDEGLQSDYSCLRRLHWSIRLGLPTLPALIIGASNPLSLAARLQLPQSQQNLLSQSLDLESFLLKSEVEHDCLNWSPVRWCQELEDQKWSPEAVALLACKGHKVWHYLIRWWGRWRHIRPSVSASELIKKGWEPGPKLGKEIQRLRWDYMEKEKIK